MNTRREQVRNAIKALGYDPEQDQIVSMYADVHQIIVRRLQHRPEGGIEVVEDRILTVGPGNMPEAQQVDPDYELGPLE